MAATATLYTADKNRVVKQQRIKKELDKDERIKSFEAKYGRIPLFFGQTKYWDRVNKIQREEIKAHAEDQRRSDKRFKLIAELRKLVRIQQQANLNEQEAQLLQQQIQELQQQIEQLRPQQDD